jgi:hypothetical protein
LKYICNSYITTFDRAALEQSDPGCAPVCNSTYALIIYNDISGAIAFQVNDGNPLHIMKFSIGIGLLTRDTHLINMISDNLGATPEILKLGAPWRVWQGKPAMKGGEFLT